MKNILIAFVALISVGIIAWSGFSLINSGSSSQVFAKMHREMEDLSSFKFAGTLSLDGTFVSDELPSSGIFDQLSDSQPGSKSTTIEGKINTEFGGVVERTQEKSYAMQGDINFSYETQQGNGQAGLSIVSLDKSVYLKLNTASIKTEAQAQVMINALIQAGQNKWIEFANTRGTEQDEVGNQDTQNIQEDISEYFKNIDHVVDFVVLGDEEVREVSTTKVSVKINEQKTFETIRAETKKQENRDLTVTEEAQIRADIKAFSQLDYTLWVGKNDYLPRKIQVSGPISHEVEQYEGNMNLSVEFFDFNTPNTISAPEGAIDFEELMTIMIGGMMGGLDLNTLMQLETSGSAEELSMPGIDPSQMDVEALQKLYAEQGIQL